MQRRVLIAEDDPNMGSLLEENLRMAGYETLLAVDGADARRLFASEAIDLCILDVMMPKKDGFQVAREIRELDPTAAFIFLTAKNTLMDKTQGFNAGCDDYVTKPFEVHELLLRINAIMERTAGPRLHRPPLVQLGRLTLDLRSRSLMLGKQRVELTEKEVRILQILGSHPNEVVTRTELLERVWGKDDPFHSKSLDVYLTRIRKHLRFDPGVVLHNVHGRGYRLVVSAV